MPLNFVDRFFESFFLGGHDVVAHRAWVVVRVHDVILGLTAEHSDTVPLLLIF